jgi:uncharacterized protein YaaW (UPF0174 family)
MLLKQEGKGEFKNLVFLNSCFHVHLRLKSLYNGRTMLGKKEVDDQIESLLKQANKEELISLLKIVDDSAIEKDINREVPQRIIETLFTSGYLQSLTQVADKLDVKYNKSMYKLESKNLSIKVISDLEKKILNNFLQLGYKQMSDAEKSKFDREVKDIATEFGHSKKGVVGAAGLMTIANLGGFSTYMLMSSFHSSVSLGTLGFGAYTAASSMLSTIIGPVGWAALGLYAIYKFSKPNYKKLIPGVILVALIRQRIEYDKEQAKLAAMIGNKVAKVDTTKKEESSFLWFVAIAICTLFLIVILVPR